jgi:acyl-CoA thioesterase YciA
MNESKPMDVTISPTGEPAIRVLMMPRDTNGQGTIFGGVLLSYIDQAGAVAAQRVTENKIVTVAIHEVVFRRPVQVGDLVSFYASVEKVGRTSITTRVEVSVARRGSGDSVHVTSAVIVYVAIDQQGNSVPVAG